MREQEPQSGMRCHEDKSSASLHENGANPEKDDSQALTETQAQPASDRHPEITHNESYTDDTSASNIANTKQNNEYTEEARNLVRTFTELSSGYPNSNSKRVDTKTKAKKDLDDDDDGSRTPRADTELTDVEYVPAPKEYKPSVFGALLKSANADSQKVGPSAESDRVSSSTVIPSSINASSRDNWRYETKDATLATTDKFHVSGSTDFASEKNVPHENIDAEGDIDLEKGETHQHGDVIHNETGRQDHVVTEVADIIARRRLLIKICESFMTYGAPTHRLEDYLKSAARALEIDAVFMYMPGTMTCTFRDETLQTNTIELIRGREGLDFARLKDAFDVYKRVVHEPPNPSERKLELESIENRADKYTIWFRILMFGLSSVIVGPFSFQARPIDFIPVFFLGCALGFMQLKVVPRSEHFSNVFEVSAAVVVAFVARGLGSIKVDGDYLFCFSATAQSGIALILPGFMILNAALELQGQSMVAGSVRMVYAIIYVLFLGFGLLIGMTLYGLMDQHAVTETTCRMPTWFGSEGVAPISETVMIGPGTVT